MRRILSIDTISKQEAIAVLELMLDSINRYEDDGPVKESIDVEVEGTLPPFVTEN